MIFTINRVLLNITYLQLFYILEPDVVAVRVTAFSLSLSK